MQDGKKSFRQIAKETKVSTPTVESHFIKMKGMGLIKNIEPVLDLNKIESQVHALMYIKVDPLYSMNIADRLSSFVEVKDVYTTTGEYNMVLKLDLDSVERLEEFVRQNVFPIEGIKSLSYNIITKIIKEDHSMRITEGLSIRVKCDYCRSEIVGYAKVFNIGNKFERNFCCTSSSIANRGQVHKRMSLIKVNYNQGNDFNHIYKTINCSINACYHNA